MARGICSEKRMAAAAKALRAAGCEVGGIEVHKDGFKILVASNTPVVGVDDLDRELAQFVKTHHGQD